MPLLQVTLIEGRPPELLEAFIAEVTETVVGVLDVPRESVRVVINEVPATHWGIAGVSREKARRDAAAHENDSRGST